MDASIVIKADPSAAHYIAAGNAFATIVHRLVSSAVNISYHLNNRYMRYKFFLTMPKIDTSSEVPAEVHILSIHLYFQQDCGEVDWLQIVLNREKHREEMFTGHRWELGSLGNEFINKLESMTGLKLEPSTP